MQDQEVHSIGQDLSRIEVSHPHLTRILRDTRQTVESLLLQGEIEEAEKLMRESQWTLKLGGYSIRKINQAYFAFYGTYTDLPQSSSPIGPKIKEIWKLTGKNIGVFLTTMRTISSVNDLDEILATFREK